ncbi:uncharacterized protein LOC122664429 [Telopea speciosissima]|uniref:uncharacterized protein LOC122664429 n=1 Tax=Telopea speciosissima TaxID=54955 RepID=UPI001CC76394|nr:uncharacterized protein LOC122664429 [Telopea speciosissima]
MLSGPFYPILHIVNERETARASGNISDLDTLKNSQASTLTVSSNFEAQPRRSRSPLPFVQPASCSVIFGPDAVFVLLRKAYKDYHLGTVCRVACRVLQKLIGPIALVEASTPSSELTSSVSDEILKTEGSKSVITLTCLEMNSRYLMITGTPITLICWILGQWKKGFDMFFMLVHHSLFKRIKKLLYDSTAFMAVGQPW